MKKLIADGAIDNYATYRLLKYYNMVPFISIDAQTRAKFKHPHPGIDYFDCKGNPVRHGGIPFVNWGLCKPYRIKYRCWFAATGQEIPEYKCLGSKYGKTIYIKPDFDPRMFTPVPSGSDAFKKKFKARTSVERSNKRIFEDYAIEEYDSRSAMLRTALVAFAVVNIHLDAWVKHTGLASLVL